MENPVMRITNILGASVLASAIVLAAQSAQAFTFSNANPAITVTATAAPPASTCTWGTPPAATFALGNFQKAGDTPGANKGVAVAMPFTCTGAAATVTVSAASANAGKLQSGATNAFSIAYDFWPGATTLPTTGTPLALTATPKAFPTTIAATAGVAANATFYINVKATTPLVAVGAPANITASTPFTDTITLSATYN